MAFLLEWFKNGFNIGYQGPPNQRNLSRNIPFTVNNQEILWGKIMKEVKAKSFTGPFIEPPFEYFVQSPIGLVPKAGGETRLIFYLSFEFSEEEKLVNACTPQELCSITYQDLDHAVKWSLDILKKIGIYSTLWYGKTDLKLAFRCCQPPLESGGY